MESLTLCINDNELNIDNSTDFKDFIHRNKQNEKLTIQLFNGKDDNKQLNIEGRIFTGLELQLLLEFINQ